MSDIFSPEAYRALLKEFLEMGYQVRGFDVANPDRKHLILRHDIDMSLQDADPIAEIEANLGLSATYFVLLKSEFYNPFSLASVKALDSLRDRGHSIGLHLDASLYPDSADALEAAAGAECDVLATLIGAPVRSISFHRPANALIGYDKSLAGRMHAYEPRFVEAMGYVSDSRGGWHNGHPLNHSAVKGERALQLLTHPIWWAGEMAEPTARLDRFLESRHRLLQAEMAQNCSIYSPPSERDPST